MGKHAEWRKLAKKARRKRIRQEIAAHRKNAEERERIRQENSPRYQAWLQEQEQIEEFNRNEENRQAREAEEKFVEREKEAQKHWQELQKKLAAAKEEQAKQIARIKEEWEREQKKLNELKEEKERKEEEKRKQQEKLQERIEEFINSNGDMPDELNELLESNPGKMTCPFFKKTAACRFNDNCSRNHVRPTISRVLLIKNFYSHYNLEQTMENEHGSDSTLEFESYEIYSHYKEFFYDVVPELEKHGQVRQFKVCCNKEPHLRGNVYVEYSDCREAIRSYRVFQGRWYGGKQLNVEFCNIGSWKSAICGLFFLQRCPKGSVCNFLHVFRNPGSLFAPADRDLHRTPPTNVNERNEHSERSWRWSESPERKISINFDQPNGSRSNHKHNDTRRERKRKVSRNGYRESSRKIRSKSRERRRKDRSTSRESCQNQRSNSTESHRKGRHITSEARRKDRSDRSHRSKSRERSKDRNPKKHKLKDC